jgi:short/branched chain acyl-CoA dehydrogenase
MEFELTDEQVQLRSVVREFAATEVAPHAEDWDREARFPVETVLRIGELGRFGLLFPPEYGGAGPGADAGSDAGNTRNSTAGGRVIDG